MTTKHELIESLKAAHDEYRFPAAPCGADLRGANLYRANLYGADMSRANLYAADMRGADLSRADLSRADLYGASLYGADLRGANLSRADLYRANLYSADLRSANLYRANLYGANLYGANLYGANLYGADLREAELRDAVHEHFMPINAVKSGKGALYPTHEGWRVSIGCWRHKTLDEWDALLADKVGWPESKGREHDRHRPLLVAYRALADEFIAAMPADLIELHKDAWKVGA